MLKCGSQLVKYKTKTGTESDFVQCVLCPAFSPALQVAIVVKEREPFVSFELEDIDVACLREVSNGRMGRKTRSAHDDRKKR